MSGESLGAFNELLAINQVANFAWWNEEHNYYIDLRASIPMRRGALAIAAAVGADTYDDALFLFFRELMDVSARAASSGPTCSRWPPTATTTTTTTRTCARRLPKVVGTLPEKIEDPVLIEIFGMHQHYFEGLKSDVHTTVLKGFPASAGIVHGQGPGDGLGDGAVRARGGRDPRHRGDVAELDAGVRDHRRLRVRRRRFAHPRRDGSREYGIPCVVGTSVATLRIKTGDSSKSTAPRAPSPSSNAPRADRSDVAGKRIVVTGAARGIGAELAAELRVTRCRRGHGRHQCPAPTCAATSATRQPSTSAFAELGALDGLVNNAALLVSRKTHDEIPLDEWDRMFAVNVQGHVPVRAGGRAGAMPNGGSIVNVASETAFTGSHGFVHYVASKGAVVSLTRALANELGRARHPRELRRSRLHDDAGHRRCSARTTRPAHRSAG